MPWRIRGRGNKLIRMALLRYLDDAGRVQTRTIDNEQFVIGRSPTCQLPLDSEMISREHVRIELTARAHADRNEPRCASSTATLLRDPTSGDRDSIP